MRTQLDAWLDTHASDFLASLQNVLRIPSVKDDTTVNPSANAPFGQPIADALDYTLSVCDAHGLATENFAGFAGHADFGAGTEIAAMLGHLDVVPVGKGWTHDPWSATLTDDDYLWGRGTSDDKGPTFAAMWGAFAVKAVCEAQGITLSRRVRLIFGCDEESGWECMAHYFGAAGQAKPTVAFTPDAMFPLVFAEKGSFTGVVEKILTESSADVRLVSFASGQRPNMVPDDATAVLVGNAEALGMMAFVLKPMPGISATLDGDTLTVLAKGKAAHGSTPDEGDNAAVKLARALTSNLSAFDDLDGAASEWLADVVRRGASTTGAANGIDCTDEVTGALTCNMGVVSLAGGVAQTTFNVRYPATLDGETILQNFRDSAKAGGYDVVDLKHTPPLYVPVDAEPVRTLLRVYREHTGDQTPPKTMGGRTYATSVAPVGVAFGAMMEGDLELAHQADERVTVARLIMCAKIYAQALYEMAK
ncbi:MAG: Sapep family Mn(2+)-dependent dipeptidase [Armatimonadetes bacterium]|nr:Sapep family Mn(2+)-dependent dipeptidase [Armatimonadota bacterium]